MSLCPGWPLMRMETDWGQGGGYYDRFLPQTHALRVGYCFQTQMVRRLDPEPHDVKMDYICTEIYTYDCAKKQTK